MSNQNIKVTLSLLRGSMKNLEAKIHEVDQAWASSPLYRFSYADHMPTYLNETPKSDIFVAEQEKCDASLEFAAFSEQHRDNPRVALDWVLGGKFAYNDPKHVRYYQERAEYVLE